MKKSYNPISDGNSEKNELARRIYRSLLEVVRQLDDVRGRSKNISDLFLPCLATLRIKLHDLCYKLILTDPLGYGKKGEDILWKKGYHDVFTTAKRLKKNDKWSPQEASFVQGLLISGMGRYQHLLFKLQSEYKINIQGLIDFPLNISELGIVKVKPSLQKSSDESLEDWAKNLCHRCLIYLGDLNRYLLDVFPLWDGGTAERYYLQAANINTVCGRPFNQLGTLSGVKNYNLDAVYYYMRCLIRPEAFEGTDANLRKSLDKNLESFQLDSFLSDQPRPTVQKFISTFLLLFDYWYFEKTTDYSVHDLSQDVLRHLQLALIEEPEKSLQLDENELELSNLTPFQDRIRNNATNLNAGMILKVSILCFICVEKLQKKDSQNTSLAVLTSVEIFSHLLQTLTAQFEKFYSGFGLREKCLPEIVKSDGIEADIQPIACKPDEYKKDVKQNEPVNRNGHSDVQSPKKIVKYSEKKGNKNDSPLNKKKNEAKEETSDVNAVETGDAKECKTKKKNRLKTRKRVRPGSLCDSELSDSDITLTDSSSENEFSSGDSAESDEDVSSDSEGLDETLLIIDQKLKEKKLTKDPKNCEVNGTSKNSVLKNESIDIKNGNAESNVTGIKKADDEMLNLIDQNGLKVSSDKDKAKSLFTIVNGSEEHTKLNENSGGDYTDKENTKSDSAFIDTVQFSKLALTETNEHGDFSKKEKNEVMPSDLNSKKLDHKAWSNFLSQQDMLQPLKVFFDWFMSNPEILKTFVKNSKQLMPKIVKFLNLVNFGKERVGKDGEDLQIEDNANTIPISEDIIARGLSMLKKSHQNLDWDFHRTNVLTCREEFKLRVHKMIEFGHFLVRQEEVGVLFSKEEKLFYIAGQNGFTNPLNLVHEKELSNSTIRKGQLMKDMGQLWLKAEVKDLESRVRNLGGSFSPYLVIDAEALIDHTVLVKQLVGSRQFIVIIPTVVLSQLDECKRDSGRARETIRWLESQFQHGNRSLRAQKSQERVALPLIKYPKKKDKEAWNFFQIVECCHYFSRQSDFHCCPSDLLVTLLTGQKDISFTSENRKDDLGKDFSPVGVAKNFGINLEQIEAFHTKWKLSTKSHG